MRDEGTKVINKEINPPITDLTAPVFAVPVGRHESIAGLNVAVKWVFLHLI